MIAFSFKSPEAIFTFGSPARYVNLGDIHEPGFATHVREWGNAMNYSVFSAGNDRWWFRLRENDGTILLVGDIHSCRQDVIHAIERTRECSQHERLFKKLDLGKENFGFLLDAADGIFLARSMSFRTAAIRQSVIMHIRDHALRAPLHPLASQT